MFLIVLPSGAMVTAFLAVAHHRGWSPGCGRVECRTRPDEVLLPLIASVALVGILWLGCGIVLEVLAGMPGAIGGGAERAATVLTPRQVRAVIATLLGIGITAGLATGASAVGSAPPPHTAPSPASRPMTPDPGVSSLPDPGVPSIPTVRPQPDVRVLSPVPRDDPADRDSPHEVVVHRGDSLWAIAARHLGTEASDAEIAEAWPDWYAANRHVIGSDPTSSCRGRSCVRPRGSAHEWRILARDTAEPAPATADLTRGGGAPVTARPTAT